MQRRPVITSALSEFLDVNVAIDARWKDLIALGENEQQVRVGRVGVMALTPPFDKGERFAGPKRPVSVLEDSCEMPLLIQMF